VEHSSDASESRFVHSLVHSNLLSFFSTCRKNSR
jgi:hypothetical protein